MLTKYYNLIYQYFMFSTCRLNDIFLLGLVGIGWDHVQIFYGSVGPEKSAQRSMADTSKTIVFHYQCFNTF